MDRLRIILFCTLAAMTYGVLHDQITARVCLEYFTVAHPPLFHTTSPTRLAVYWGAAATAGIGLTFGSVLALVANSAGQPAYPFSRLARQILELLAVMGVSATAAACAGFFLAPSRVHFDSRRPEGRHPGLAARRFHGGLVRALGELLGRLRREWHIDLPRLENARQAVGSRALSEWRTGDPAGSGSRHGGCVDRLVAFFRAELNHGVALFDFRSTVEP